MRRAIAAAVVLVMQSTPSWACADAPVDGFDRASLLDGGADLIARGTVVAVEDVTCERDIGGGVPIDHNCLARLRVAPTVGYNDTALPAGHITLLLPFYTGGYSVAAGAAAPRVAAGREGEIVFLAAGPAEGPGFERPIFGVLADACLHSSVRAASDPTIADLIAEDALRVTHEQAAEVIGGDDPSPKGE